MTRESRSVGNGRFYGIGILWLAVLYAIDQVSKYLAYTRLRFGEPIVLIPRVLRLEYLENRGVAFGFMEGKQILVAFLTFLIVAFLAYALIRMPHTRRYLLLNRLAFLMIAGALGNLTDRVIRGFVVDFIYFNLIDFPVFNVADICVVLAGILILLSQIVIYRDEDDLDFLKIGRKEEP